MCPTVYRKYSLLPITSKPLQSVYHILSQSSVLTPQHSTACLPSCCCTNVVTDLLIAKSNEHVFKMFYSVFYLISRGVHIMNKVMTYDRLERKNLALYNGQWVNIPSNYSALAKSNKYITQKKNVQRILRSKFQEKHK